MLCIISHQSINHVGILNMDLELTKDIILKKIKNNKDTITKQWTTPEETSTKHFYIDNLLPDELANAIYNAFPKDDDNFYKRKSFRERKSTFANFSDSSPLLSDITKAFQLPEIIEEISNITSMKALEADPSLYASGLSMMFDGDFLNPHIDNSHDGNRKRYRRLNLLYYVTPGWGLEYGGNFELWDNKVKKQKTIVSKFNRLVVMETNDKSWHSVSPVAVNNHRCCVSNYYFSDISPNGSEYFHVTSFTGRPKERGKRILGVVDNFLRNTISKVLKIGRGKELINKHNK